MGKSLIDSIVIGKRRRKDLGDISGLADSIADVGLLHPIVVTPEYHLVAGERRLEACKILAWTEVPVTVVDNLDDAVVALRAEIDENVERKELLPSEYVPASEELEKLEQAAAKERQEELGRTHGTPCGKFPEGSTGETRDKVAATVGVSGKTYEKAKAVYQAAEEDPETFAPLLDVMDKSVDKAYREFKTKKREVADEACREELAHHTERYRLIHCEIAGLSASLGPESVDVIITDPPYPEEYLPLFGELSKMAAVVLKPGGSLLAMSGQSYLPEVYTLLGQHLDYQWTIGYLTPGAHGVQWHRSALTGWKPVLWYVKDEYKGPRVFDVVTSEAPDKDHHDWGQSESGMAQLVERFSRIGDTVLDPFCGAGTTGVVAVKLDRLFIGADIDTVALDRTAARLAECDVH